MILSDDLRHEHLANKIAVVLWCLWIQVQVDTPHPTHSREAALVFHLSAPNCFHFSPPNCCTRHIWVTNSIASCMLVMNEAKHKTCSSSPFVSSKFRQPFINYKTNLSRHCLSSWTKTDSPRVICLSLFLRFTCSYFYAGVGLSVHLLTVWAWCALLS